MIMEKEEANRTIDMSSFKITCKTSTLYYRAKSYPRSRCKVLEVRTIGLTCMTDLIMLSKWCSCMGDDVSWKLGTTLSAGRA